MSAGPVVVPHENLRALAAAIFEGMGSEPAEAKEVADHMIEANLTGHDSHGIVLITKYMENYEKGLLRVNQHAKQAGPAGLFAVFEGNMGFGQVIAREATDWGIATARKDGVGIFGLRHVQHIGRVGTYGEQAAAAGMVYISFVKAHSGPPYVAPFGGSDGRLATNPVTIAMPGKDAQSPIVLDFATAGIAMGKVRVAYNRGAKLPDGMLIDEAGGPTNDPGVLFPDRTKGAILPIGGSVTGHKGYGLALVCELLAGALIGNLTYKTDQKYNLGALNSMLAIVFDPARLNATDSFHSELSSFVDFVKASPPASPDKPVLVAGEAERISRAKRLVEGIAIDSNSWRNIAESATTVGIDAARFAELTKVPALT